MSVQHFKKTGCTRELDPEYLIAEKCFYRCEYFYIHCQKLTLCLSEQLPAFFDGIINGTNQVERCLGIFVHLTIHDHVKAPDGFLDRHHHPFQTREGFRYVKGLRKKPLNPAGPGNR